MDGSAVVLLVAECKEYSLISAADRNSFWGPPQMLLFLYVFSHSDTFFSVYFHLGFALRVDCGNVLKHSTLWLLLAPTSFLTFNFVHYMNFCRALCFILAGRGLQKLHPLCFLLICLIFPKQCSWGLWSFIKPVIFTTHKLGTLTSLTRLSCLFQTSWKLWRFAESSPWPSLRLHISGGYSLVFQVSHDFWIKCSALCYVHRHH